MMSFSVPAFLLSANFLKPKIRGAGYAASRPIFVETTNPYSESRVKVESSFLLPFFYKRGKIATSFPGCGWSRGHLWRKFFHQGRVKEQFLSISTEVKERRSLVIPKLTTHGQITKYTFEILQSYFKLHKGQTKYIYIQYIQHIEVSLWFQFQPVELLRRKTDSLFYVA